MIACLAFGTYAQDKPRTPPSDPEAPAQPEAEPKPYDKVVTPDFKPSVAGPSRAGGGRLEICGENPYN